mmetsp:Transcript_30133/g.78219  ORF Transcript_30133/g.78219 Transcript_30133/m.78219 type:complete len:280 (-) Transcript_30133:939-1778(-)
MCTGPPHAWSREKRDWLSPAALERESSVGGSCLGSPTRTTRQFGFSKGSGMSAAGSSAWAASSMIRASNRWGMTLVLCVAVVGVAPEALWGRAASAWANSPPATFSVHTVSSAALMIACRNSRCARSNSLPPLRVSLSASCSWTCRPLSCSRMPRTALWWALSLPAGPLSAAPLLPPPLPPASSPSPRHPSVSSPRPACRSCWRLASCSSKECSSSCAALMRCCSCSTCARACSCLLPTSSRSAPGFPDSLSATASTCKSSTCGWVVSLRPKRTMPGAL